MARARFILSLHPSCFLPPGRTGEAPVLRTTHVPSPFQACVCGTADSLQEEARGNPCSYKSPEIQNRSERSVLLKSPSLHNTSKRTPSPHPWSGPKRRDDPNSLYRTNDTSENLECPMVPESWGNGTLGKFASLLGFHITFYKMEINLPVLFCRVYVQVRLWMQRRLHLQGNQNVTNGNDI